MKIHPAGSARTTERRDFGQRKKLTNILLHSLNLILCMVSGLGRWNRNVPSTPRRVYVCCFAHFGTVTPRFRRSPGAAPLYCTGYTKEGFTLLFRE